MAEHLNGDRAPAPQLEFRHMALIVHDIEIMEAFYTKVLGFAVSDQGELDYGGEDGRGKIDMVFLSLDPDEHHQMILVSGRPKELSFNHINHMAFRVKNIAEVRAGYERLVGAGADEIRPVTHGNAFSVYFRDPEGNRLEIYTPSPWHIPQPYREPIDFSLSDDEILARTKADIESRAGFMTREQRLVEMEKITGKTIS